VDVYQAHMTGEVQLHGVDHTSGRIIDRDVWPEGDEQHPTAVVTKGDIVTLTLNGSFLRHLQEAKGGVPHILVYAEVFDDASDNPATSFTKVIHDFQGAPEQTLLTFADRPIYGPTPFTGFPLRVRLYVVELDREQKQVASRIIDAAGRVGAQYAPTAAPFIGIGIEIAQLINALNRDDFELRFDLTFYPAGPAARYDVRQPDVPLEARYASKAEQTKRKIRTRTTGNATFYENIPANSPALQRQGEPVTLNTSLRTGKYLITKRETDTRGDKSKINTIEFDWAQPVQSSYYRSADKKTTYRADEIIRLQGDTLWRITERVEKVLPGDDQWQEVDGADVALASGPNAGQPFSIQPGQRQLVRDQTYAVLTISTGGDVSLSQDQLRQASDRDAKRLQSLLDVPPGTDAGLELADRVDAVATAITSTIELRDASRRIGKRVASDPSIRVKPDYVVLWTQQVRAVPDANDAARRAVVARNAAVLDVLEGLVVNLPMIRPDDPRCANFAQLKAEHFEAVAPPGGSKDSGGDGAAADPGAAGPAKKKKRGAGTFTITEDGIKILNPEQKAAKPAGGGAGGGGAGAAGGGNGAGGGGAGGGNGGTGGGGSAGAATRPGNGT
jgi:hypothetical protein